MGRAGKINNDRGIPACQLSSTEIAVKPGYRQAGIGQSPGPHFGMPLHKRDSGRFAGRMPVYADDKGLVLETHELSLKASRQ